MTLNEIILNAYPEILDLPRLERDKIYTLRNDSDGVGDYIEKWEYHKPIPEGFKLGKN